MFSIAKLLPREEKFYTLIERLSGQAALSARHLLTLVQSCDAESRKAAAAEISKARDAAKKLSAETTAELCQTFITPFDREDIQGLAGNLYKIPKTIDKIREYADLHLIDCLKDLVPQAEVIVQEAEAMESMVHALLQGGKAAQVAKQAALLDSLENKGDAVLGQLLVDLLKNTEDPRQFILRKEVYDMLERVIDKYRNAAEIALQITLKHS
jgi:uncharacterized protein Yka (UPF0111/DUF47 family)